MESKIDFNDILIVPKKTTSINSRYSDVYVNKPYPIFTAPMDTVVGVDNYREFIDNGINVVLPRTIPYIDAFSISLKTSEQVFVSLGFNEIIEIMKNNFNGVHSNACILIDVANGHMVKIIDICKHIKKSRPDIKIMVGNIANPKTYKKYADSKSVDYIRIGIGNGNGCLTTKHSGVGYPMASLIIEINEIRNKLISRGYDKNILPKIIADGGMKEYADVIKAIALGADYVMLGSILNKCIESEGDNYIFNIKVPKRFARKLYRLGLPITKYFRGMSTKEAQTAMGKSKLKTSEGVVRYRKVEYDLKKWVSNFDHYLRNQMSYCNASVIDDFKGKVEYIKITSASYDRFNK